MGKPKGRPKKVRVVETNPKIVQFSPRGRPGRPEEAELSLDEYEAIRLADFKRSSQIAAGKSMGVSRQTFGRILLSARKKIAEGLVSGKIIRFTGGRVKIG